MAGLSACGKSIQITDSASPSSSAPVAPPAPATNPASAPPVSTSGAQADGSTLQIVDSTAAENGKTGTGGTVIGTTIQETPPKWVQLSAVQSPELGSHLINVNQATLYRFDKDTAQPSQSNCNDACATTWPPVTIVEGGSVYLAGVDPKQVGAIRREDGKAQVTLNGQPLYRYSGDKGAGDAEGQGIDGTWFAVGPTGEKSVK